MKLIFTLALGLVTIIGLVYSQQASSLNDVKKIYVDTFGSAEGADMIKEKVVNRLVKSGRIAVVDSAEAADAVMVGIGEVSKGVQYTANANKDGGSASGGTRYDATLVVRLIGKDKQILWVDEAKPGFLARSASSGVADKVAKDLLKAIEKAAKQK